MGSNKKDEIRENNRPRKYISELLEAHEDYGIDKTTTLPIEIYDTGQISPDIS